MPTNRILIVHGLEKDTVKEKLTYETDLRGFCIPVRFRFEYIWPFLIELSCKAQQTILVRRQGTKIDSRFKAELDPDITITIPEDAVSAFQGGTLRPLESLESILDTYRSEHAEVWSVGTPFHPLVVQTALDANALGFKVKVFMDGSFPWTAEGLGKLDKAGVQVV